MAINSLGIHYSDYIGHHGITLKYLTFTLCRRLIMKIDQLPTATQQALEAASFRRLLQHLESCTDVQNIDLMNLAGFCRNCLSKWYVAAAQEQAIELDYEDARTRIYGMPYAQWKEKYQTEASAAQLEQFQQAAPNKHE
jgi:hypothetical protein